MNTDEHTNDDVLDKSELLLVDKYGILPLKDFLEDPDHPCLVPSSSDPPKPCLPIWAQFRIDANKAIIEQWMKNR